MLRENYFSPKPVETVYEEKICGYIYRFYESWRGVYVKRTLDIGCPLWSHGTQTEVFQVDTNKFVASLLSVGQICFLNMNEAMLHISAWMDQ